MHSKEPQANAALFGGILNLHEQGRFVMTAVEKGGWVYVDYVTRLGGWLIRAQELYDPSTVKRGGILYSITGLRRFAPPHEEWQTSHPPMGRHDTTLDLKWVHCYQLHLPNPITKRSHASTPLTSPTRVTSTEVPGTNSRRSSLS